MSLGLEKMEKEMDEKYRRIYRMLKRYGFSAAKSLEILFDASRGDKYAMSWIKMIHRSKRIHPTVQMG